MGNERNRLRGTDACPLFGLCIPTHMACRIHIYEEENLRQSAILACTMDSKRTGDFSPDILTDQYLVYQLHPLH